jgi:hypothetical protein
MEEKENAKKDFYAGVLEEDEKEDLEAAKEVDGIEEEIALIRVKIRYIMANAPENMRLLLQAINALVKLLTIQYSLNKQDEKDLEEAIHKLMKDIGLPTVMDDTKKNQEIRGN